MDTDNPAARLLHILREGKNMEPHLICKDVWFELLKIEDGDTDTALLMSRLGKVMNLPQKIIDRIQYHYPGEDDANQHWVKTIGKAFSTQNLYGSWSSFNQHIDNHTIDYLKSLVRLLNEKETTQILKKDELSDIYKKINRLLTETLKSDIDENFKYYIVKYLRKIIVSIEEYEISGVTPVMESIEAALGHSVIDKNYDTNLFKTDTGKKIIKILGVVTDIVANKCGFPLLQGQLQQLIGIQQTNS